MSQDDLFLTPQIEARDDGLCPTLLSADYTATLSSTPDPNDPMTKTCETNSRFLRRNIRDKKNSSEELEFICESISAFLMDNVDEEEKKSALVGLDFDIQGCVWWMDINPNLGSKDFQIHVDLAANHTDDKEVIRWAVRTSLYDKVKGEIVPKSLAGHAEVKDAWDQTAVIMRKAIMKCEFPEFPEGGKGRHFKEVYKLNAKLKTGTFSTICRGTHRVSGRVVAVKCVRRLDLPPADDAAVYDEVAILASLSTVPPHIVPLLDFFEEDDTYFLVKELLTGGGVLERIGEMGYRYNERIARGVVFNIIEALSFCHSRNIAHRDVNSKNLMFVNEDKDTGVKLAGFAYAVRYHAPKSLSRQCGTPFFVAPEVLKKQPYDQGGDLWSAGCLAYLLLCGQLPFVGANQKELFRNIVAGNFDFGHDEWADVSEEARDFIRKLLVVDVAKRMDAEEALRHAWMQLPQSELNPRILEDSSKRIKQFHEKMHPSSESNSH